MPQSTLSGDGAKPVPLMEHLRRVRCGSGRQLAEPTASSGSSVVPLVGNVGLKDLLLSNDEDDVMTPTIKSQGSTSSSSSSGSAMAVDDEAGKVMMSETGTRPDSSTTKHSKPAVLLMSLLSRPDDDDDRTSSGSGAAADKLDGHAGMRGLMEDGHSEQPVRNHLLRV